MPNILIVDDNIVLTLELEELLTSIGHKVVGTAYSGDQAIELARALRPDLVLMNIAMQGELDGIAASEILKAELDISVIFISIHTDKDFLERAKRVEPLGYIHRPFSEQQIAAAIEMAFYKNNREKELRKAYDELELRVKNQSDQLARTNALLEIKSVEIVGLDAALKLLMEHMGGQQTKLEANVLSNLTDLVISLLDKFKESGQGINQKSVIEAVEAILGNFVTPFLRKLPAQYHDFTLAELRVAALLKEGKDSKEVAKALNIAPSTVVWHRKRIRKKLGIQHTKEEIRNHLPSIK